MKKLIFFACLLLLVGCGKSETEIEASYIYVLFTDRDMPKLDYEGHGALKSSRTLFDQVGDTEFECELTYHLIPDGESYIAGGINDDPDNTIGTMSAKVFRDGENRFRMTAQLQTKIPVTIQYVMIQPEQTDGVDLTDPEFPEVTYPVGTHDISFSGSILGWYTEGSSHP